MPECPHCGRTFGDRGVKIHIGRKHKLPPSSDPALATLPSPDPPPPVPPDPVLQADLVPETPASNYSQGDALADLPTDATSEDVECPVCHRICDNSRAFHRHFVSHPVEANLARAANVRARSQRRPPPASSAAHEEALPVDITAETDKWYLEFDRILQTIDQFQEADFFTKVSEFQMFLSNAVERTPGPVHPATAYYRRRRKKADTRVGAKQSLSSNPKRTDANRRKRLRAKFEYEAAQFDYYYMRKRIARKILDNDQSKRCSISSAELYEHFRSVFEAPNDNTLAEYSMPSSPHEDISISVDEIKQTIAKMKVDSSPGKDRVLMKTVKVLNIASVLQRIVSIMLATGAVPPGLRTARTVLIDKGGDPSSVSNWRPISMFSVLRRIIERVLDKRLRQQVDLCSSQRGFVSGMPGCQVNTRLVNACLTQAKANKSDCAVVFIDISKAFDNIGHRHLEQCLHSHGVSSNMIRLISALLVNNSTRIDTGLEKTAPISIGRSVPQGGPLSPLLFNICIDFVFKQICEREFAANHGIKLAPNLDALLLTGFADDLVVTSPSLDKAHRVVQAVQSLFREIGLHVNPRKSAAIRILKGRLTPGDLVLANGDSIKCIDSDTTIRYLGSSFNSEMVFDDSLVDRLTSGINNLIKSPLLNPNQKLNILNGFVFPRLAFPLQAAPLNKIPKSHLEAIDCTIRNSAKAIIGLPTSTATAMFYSPRKFRGLGLVRCEWEAPLQHYSIATKLATVSDPLLHEVFDCETEMSLCKAQLGVEGDTTRRLRAALREGEFERWSGLSYQGEGIRHFRTYTKGNRFIYEKSALTTSEWTAAIKLSTGYANLVGVPGVRTVGGEGANLCRRCHTEPEKPCHVLGSCPYGALLRNQRHHKLKNRLADLLREKGFQCTVEAHCVDGLGSNRFIDILAVKPGSHTAFIVDPTVRYESNHDVAAEVQADKEGTYLSCIPDLRRKYRQIGNKTVEVVGLWMGARGTISSQFLAFFDRVGLDRKHLPELAVTVLADSVGMIHHHISGPERRLELGHPV